MPLPLEGKGHTEARNPSSQITFPTRAANTTAGGHYYVFDQKPFAARPRRIFLQGGHILTSSTFRFSLKLKF